MHVETNEGTIPLHSHCLFLAGPSPDNAQDGVPGGKRPCHCPSASDGAVLKSVAQMAYILEGHC